MTISHYLTRSPCAAENRCLNSSRVDCANLLKSAFLSAALPRRTRFPHDFTQLRWGTQRFAMETVEMNMEKEKERSIG